MADAGMNATRDGRILALEGGRNVRDLGGYHTAEGRSVRWGLLFRSGTIGGWTTADWDRLTALGIRAICDLRTTMEREAEPFAWAATDGLRYFARDYPTSFGELRKVMAADLPTGEAARAAMMHGFAGLPFEQAPAYRQLFAYLKAGEVPLLVNCSAGKDRAGTAAALLLSALGVPRATVVEDFVLTDQAVDLRAALFGRSEKASSLSRLPPGVADAILRADPAYIGAALDSIDARHGSLEAYLQDVLDVGADDLARLRDLLLQ